jgi:Spy/CpxP family protein refolding chaperone
MLVAFLSGNAAVGRRDDDAKWWLDSEIQGRLHLTPQQVQALDAIYTEADGKAHTLMLWRMYQTLTPPQRQQFSQLLQVRSS